MIFKCKARQLFHKIKYNYYQIFIFLVYIIIISGCSVNVRYPSEFPTKTLITFEENYWFWGLIGQKNYEVYNICKGGRIFELKISTTVLQSTFTILSFGIYTPRTTTFVCSIRGEEME